MQALINKKKYFFSVIILILFSTFIPETKNSIDKLKIKKIIIKNNQILKKEELINKFSFLQSKNIVFLNSFEIKKKINKKSFIDSIRIKKIYPDKLEIFIIEKTPIAILISKNEKFFLGKKLDLINYKKIEKLNNLPIVFGDRKKFKILFYDLKKINFPIKSIKQYNLFDSGRWNITMEDGKVIKLPIKNYTKSLKNFIEIGNKKNLEKYKTFDYRLKDQLILK